MSTAQAPTKSPEVPRAWTLVLVIAAGLLMAPFAGWVVLALWLSGFARGLHDRLARRLGGRVHLAAFITVLLMMMVLVPIGAVITTLVIDSIAFVSQLAESDKVHSLLVSLVSDKNPSPDASIGELLLMQGERAWSVVSLILSSAAQIIVGMVFSAVL